MILKTNYTEQNQNYKAFRIGNVVNSTREMIDIIWNAAHRVTLYGSSRLTNYNNQCEHQDKKKCLKRILDTTNLEHQRLIPSMIMTATQQCVIIMWTVKTKLDNIINSNIYTQRCRIRRVIDRLLAFRIPASNRKSI